MGYEVIAEFKSGATYSFCSERFHASLGTIEDLQDEIDNGDIIKIELRNTPMEKFIGTE